MGQGTEHAKWLRETLAAERARLDLSFEQVARRVANALGIEKITRQSVQKWEAFKTHPGIDEFAAWARALGLRLEVDLVREGDDRVVVMLPADVAAVARTIALLSAESREKVGGLARFLRTLEQKVSPRS